MRCASCGSDNVSGSKFCQSCGKPITVKRSRPATHICRTCLSQVRPVKTTPGSFFIELILWLCFLIPGIIYSIWRLNGQHRICPVCRSRDIVPLDTPAAAVLIHSAAQPN